MKALLKNHRQSPRKTRLVADLIRGKKVSYALPALNFVSKRAALPVKKLLLSAVANARDAHGIPEDRLFVKEVRVDEGPTLKRIRARARGNADMIRKRTSHIRIALEEMQGEEAQRPSSQKDAESISQSEK